ncbi:phage holin family protein, partial [Bacillus altitudinis]|uniref:phage holin family protein n=1 Tax=Bacillus altitudinis TaxID=293387 RepID=UPI00307D28CF
MPILPFALILPLIPTYIQPFPPAILASIIFSFLNVLVNPFFIILTLPLTVLSLPLFLFLINPITLIITSTFIPHTFNIHGVPTPISMPVILSI